jgi:hypothetical protein
VASGSPAFNWGILLGGAAALFAVLTISPVGIPGRDAPTGGPLPYPVEAQAYLHEQGRSVRVYNEYSWGGYLINTGYPDLRVFVDGRADVYGELVNEYVRAQAGRDWETTFKRYDVEYALVRPGTPLIAELRAAGWIPLVDDDDQVLLGPPGTKFP